MTVEVFNKDKNGFFVNRMWPWIANYKNKGTLFDDGFNVYGVVFGIELIIRYN